MFWLGAWSYRLSPAQRPARSLTKYKWHFTTVGEGLLRGRFLWVIISPLDNYPAPVNMGTQRDSSATDMSHCGKHDQHITSGLTGKSLGHTSTGTGVK